MATALHFQGIIIHKPKHFPLSKTHKTSDDAELHSSGQTRRSGFLRKFLSDPAGVGALAPATFKLSRTVAQATHKMYGESKGEGDPAPPRLIELGAGTGALTRCLCELNPIVVERDEAWAALLRQQFPALEVRAECALQTLSQMVEPAGIVSSIPILNNPLAGQIKQLLARRYTDGLVRFCVIYTYGWTDPLRSAGFRLGQRYDFVGRNVPPASVWMYR